MTRREITVEPTHGGRWIVTTGQRVRADGTLGCKVGMRVDASALERVLRGLEGHGFYRRDAATKGE